MKKIKLIRCISLYIALTLLLSSCVLNSDDGNQASDTTDTYAEDSQIVTGEQTSDITQTPQDDNNEIKENIISLAEKIKYGMKFSEINRILGKEGSLCVTFPRKNLRGFIWEYKYSVFEEYSILVLFFKKTKGEIVDNDDLYLHSVLTKTDDSGYKKTNSTTVDVAELAEKITPDMLYDDVCELLGGKESYYWGAGELYQAWYYGDCGEINISFDSEWIYETNGIRYENTERKIRSGFYTTAENNYTVYLFR